MAETNRELRDLLDAASRDLHVAQLDLGAAHRDIQRLECDKKELRRKLKELRRDKKKLAKAQKDDFFTDQVLTDFLAQMDNDGALGSPLRAA